MNFNKETVNFMDANELFIVSTLDCNNIVFRSCTIVLRFNSKNKLVGFTFILYRLCSTGVGNIAFSKI